MSVDDRLAILEQIGHYSYAWDSSDTDAYAALFTDDAVFEAFVGEKRVIHNVGREAIHAWAGGIHSGTSAGLRDREPGEQSRHNQSGTVFDELGPDSASTRTMLLSTAQNPGDPVPRPSTSGVYSDQWRRTTDGWRIARRSLSIDVPRAP